jgi:CHAT domain-containing protein
MGDANPGAELASLAQAFGIAGAPSIVASLWEVPDQPTYELMVTFYEGLKNESAPLALARAQRSLLSKPTTSHPYNWAAFTFIGSP